MGTIKLPYTRFVRQVSNGISRSKYSYIAMMHENEEALKNAAWAEAKAHTPALTVNQLTRTDGVVDDSGVYTKEPTYTAFLDDTYDCYTQAGDAVSRQATLCGYAGMVAYRFALPTTNPGAITEFSLRIQRDRYLRAGVRVAAQLSNSATPSDDWSVIRGTASGAIVSPSVTTNLPEGVASFGFLGQQDVDWLIAGRAMDGEIVFKASDFAALSTAASYTYLYVYLSPEDFAAIWTMYNATDARQYYIEGSAMLIPSFATFTFATEAVAPAAGNSFELVKGGIVPSFNDGTFSETVSPVLQCTTQRNGDLLTYNTIKQIAATVAGNGGTVRGCKIGYLSSAYSSGTLTHNTGYQVAYIYGYGFKGSWNDLPGLVVYDVLNREIKYFDTNLGIGAQAAQLLADGIYGVYDVYASFLTFAPTLYQIGHTDPVPVLDGTACYFSDDNFYVCSLTVNNATHEITGGASAGNSWVFDERLLGCINSSGGMLGARDYTVVADGSYLRSTHPEADEYPYSYPKCAYVGTVKGMIAIPPALWYSETETNHTAGFVFVWGEFTSINGTPVNRCAYVRWIYPNGTTSPENPVTIAVTVPDIDTDPNWPELGTEWSVRPQCSTADGPAGTFLAPDFNSYIVCGCAEGGPKRYVTGVWYATAYDENLVSGVELPHTGVVGAAPGYGGFFPATISTESASVPITDAAAGLRALFGRFRSGSLAPVPNVVTQYGAGFSVNWKECSLKSSGVKIGAWQVTCSALVVPFGCPDFGAKSITFDWTGWTGARTAGSKFHVWLARGKFDTAPAELKNWKVWGENSVPGLEYVGSIDPNGGSTSATLTLARALEEDVATLIVTASVPMDEVNPSESPVFPMGASTVAVNMADATVQNGETAFLPDITLS